MIPATRLALGPRCLLACIPLFLACSSGQIGGEVRSDPPFGGDEDLGNESTTSICEDGEATEVSPDTITTLGFAPADVLALATGSHTASFAWGDIPQDVDLTLTPEAGRGEIEVEVTVDPSTTRVVDLVPIAPDSSGTETGDLSLMAPEGGDTCGEELRFEARVRVSSSNGALDDAFEMTFASTSPYQAHSTIRLDPGKLNGSFDVAVENAQSEVLGTRLFIAFTPGGMSGSVSGTYQTTSEEVATGTVLTYGSFPIDGCAVGAVVDANSEFASEMTAILEGLPEFNLTWSGGEPTALTLAHEIQQICFQPSDYGQDAAAVLHLETTASSADGRIDGTWELEAQITLATDGTAPTLSLVRQAYLADTYPASEFEAKTGIQGVTLPEGTSGTFSFGITDDLTDEAPASGALTTYAVAVADCGDPEPTTSPSDDRAASPGCSGMTQSELETAAITAR